MSLWVCDVASMKHHNVFSHSTMGSAFWLHEKTRLPCPRFGHQFVFDPVHQVCEAVAMTMVCVVLSFTCGCD